MSEVWSAVVGQEVALAKLRRAAVAPVHAYLFTGPSGSTKGEAARAFAAVLLTGREDTDTRAARLALSGNHPDVREIERAGPAISSEQAREIVRLASLAPVEGTRKVLILHEFHLLRPEGAALLLKTIEEPPESTVFIVLADFIPPELVTISSRCVRIDFRAIPDDVLTERLIAEGADREVAANVAVAAGGDLSRARVLIGDTDLADRRRAFAGVPYDLDGTGATVVRVAGELLERIDQAASPLTARHALEVAEVDARAEQVGERGGGRKLVEERHKRELRRHRVDELRSGLAVLAASYRDALADGSAVRPDAAAEAVHRIHAAIEALERNPNEQLLLQSLLWSLPVLDPAHSSGVGTRSGSGSPRR